MKEPKHASARLTLDAIQVLDYDFTIQHAPGHKIPHADRLILLGATRKVASLWLYPTVSDKDFSLRTHIPALDA